MSARISTIAFLAGLLIGAGSAWYVASGRTDEFERRAQAAEALQGRAERDVGDWKAAAATEVARNATLEDRIAELSRLLEAERNTPRVRPDTPAAGTSAGAGAAAAPADWDDATYRQHLDLLTSAPATVRRAPTYAGVLEALRVRGKPGRLWMESLLPSGLPPSYKIVAARLLEDLGDPESAGPVLAAYRDLKDDADPQLRVALLETLGGLPGDDAVPEFLAAWNADADERGLRRIGLRGLGRRAHEVALAVARGEVKDVGAEMRHVALGNLLVRARKAGYRDTSTLGLFEDVLPGLDGERQVDVVLEALAGFAAKSSVIPLAKFAEGAVGTPEQRDRARNLSARIASGDLAPPEERPDSAGDKGGDSGNGDGDGSDDAGAGDGVKDRGGDDAAHDSDHR